MKIWQKIFVYCMLIFITIFTISGILITENNYSVMINEEIKSTLNEEKNFEMLIRNIIFANAFQKWRDNYNVYNNFSSYRSIEGIIRQNLDTSLSSYIDQNVFITIEDKVGQTIASTHNKIWEFERPEEVSAMQGNRSYILRYIEGRHYIFISNLIDLNEVDYFLISYARDITYIDDVKRNHYKSFIITEVVSILVLSVLMFFLSRYITRPIGRLINITENISKGNYNERIASHTNDEVGILAVRFNEMASKVQESINRLEIQSEDKQRFIDNLTHEMKTPLTSIIGYAEFLRTNKYDEQLFNKGLYNIYSEGKRMKSIIDKLMHIIVHKHKEIHMEDENIEDLFKEVKDIMKVSLDSSNITLETKARNISICMNKDLIKMCLVNLIYNAIKASKSGDIITLGFRQEGKSKIMYAKDRGKGIPKDELTNIIEPFYRIDKSRSRASGGAGLGLYICNEIVQLHKGKLRIKSKVNEGTIVELIL